MKKRFSVLFVLLAAGASQLFAQSENPVPEFLADFANHMEFLEYTVSSVKEKSVFFKHKSNLDVRLMIYKDGVLVSSYWGMSDAALADPEGFQKMLNTLNGESAIIKYYSDEDSLYLEAWFPGPYDKSRFSLFINLWEADWDAAVGSYRDLLKKYLK